MEDTFLHIIEIFAVGQSKLYILHFLIVMETNADICSCLISPLVRLFAPILITSGTRWYPLVPAGTRWHPLVSRVGTFI